jgi:hypothetical protein
MFEPPPEPLRALSSLYISAQGTGRGRRAQSAPLAIASMAAAKAVRFIHRRSVRTGKIHLVRARVSVAPATFITTPESLFLLDLESHELEVRQSDHRADSRHGQKARALAVLERLERIAGLQRMAVGTQRPLDEVARCPAAPLPRPAISKTQNLETPKPLKPISESVHEDLKTITVKYRPARSSMRHAEAAGCQRADTGRKTWRRWGNPFEQPSGPAREASGAMIWARFIPAWSNDPMHRRHYFNQQPPRRTRPARERIAGEQLVRAHHGRWPARRTEIEDLLKAGHLRALSPRRPGPVDMGAIDLVIQIERRHRSRAACSASAALATASRDQRRHVAPKFRGDLIFAAVTAAMRQGSRIVTLPPQSARRPGTAAGRHGVHGAVVGRRSLSHGAIGGAIRGVEPADFRRRARHAVGPLPVG